MASTDFRFNMSTKEALQLAEKEGFVIETLRDKRDRRDIRVTHPKMTDGLTVTVMNHGEVNGNLIQYLAKSTKRLRQRERLEERVSVEQQTTTAPGFSAPFKTSAASSADDDQATSNEPEVPAPTFNERVNQVAETLVIWLDEQQQDGLRQFTRASINNKVRERVGLPTGSEGSDVIVAALEKLVRLNILSSGILPASSGRNMQAYRLNSFNGVTIYDAYEGKAALKAPPAPDPEEPMKVEVEPEPEPEPEPMPTAPEPVAAPTAEAVLANAMAAAVANNSDLRDQMIDVFIRGRQFAALARLILPAGSDADVNEVTKALERVAAASREKC
jgi:hypothetical protein